MLNTVMYTTDFNGSKASIEKTEIRGQEKYLIDIPGVPATEMNCLGVCNTFQGARIAMTHYMKRYKKQGR